jgi:carbonic anhydrase
MYMQQKEGVMSSIDLLLDRNRTFVAERFSGPMALMPQLRTTVIGCLDPRVDPAYVLGLQLGDAPVIRNVGGRVTPAVLQVLDLLALGFPAEQERMRVADKGDLVVLHHSQCGITRMQSHPEWLAPYFGVPVDELPAKAVGDPRASLLVDVDVLRRHPGISAAYRVTGLYYDVTTGAVETVRSSEAAA